MHIWARAAATLSGLRLIRNCLEPLLIAVRRRPGAPRLANGCALKGVVVNKAAANKAKTDGTGGSQATDRSTGAYIMLRPGVLL